MVLCSLPIVVAWGLPLSTLSILGNMLFSPFITLFLLLSVLLLAGYIVGFPAGPLPWCLEQVTNIWFWGLEKGSSAQLYAFPCPPWWILLCVPLSLLIVLYGVSERRTEMREILCLGALLGIWCALFTLYGMTTYRETALPYGNRMLSIHKTSSGLVVVDRDGVLRAGAHNGAWAKFTLRSLLAKCFGQRSCQMIVLMHPSQSRLEAAVSIADQVDCPLVSIPDWYKGDLGPLMARAPRVVILKRSLTSLAAFAGKELTSLKKDCTLKAKT